MATFDNIVALHRELSARRVPVSVRDLAVALETSETTVKRAIGHLRNHFGAPLENVRGQGYRYARDERNRFELPGLWFSADELQALALLHQLLEQINPELLGRALAPVRDRIDGLVRLLPGGHGGLARLSLLPQGQRRVRPATLGVLAQAVVARRRVHFAYHARGRDADSLREVSPQRLAYYRDNWYLDAWCHRRDALRRFAVDRVRDARLRETDAQEVPAELLQRHLGEAYGIFTGPAAHTAVLRFSAHRARWVADEQWHPRQYGQWLLDGRYELRVPYADPTELLMDVLRHAPEVEVVAPPDLRADYKARLRAALAAHDPD